jgi:hypothetical protein
MRLDMLTSDWHRLLRPVLPHASTDKDSWSLHAVRLELGPLALYAIATDRYTLAAERHVLPPDSRYRETEWAPVHILTGETRASLKMFTYSKDSDPELRITVDRSAILVPGGSSIDSWAVMIERPDDGTRMTLRDRRDPAEVNYLTQWREPLLKAFTRAKGRSLDGLDMRGDVLGRWKDAARGTERLRVWTGPERGDVLLITVERHFAGIQGTDLMLDDPSRERSALPWSAELLPAGISDGGELLDGEQ